MSSVLRKTLRALRATADALPDTRNGPNLKYTLSDAVLSSFACFFLQCRSFRFFERRLEQLHTRSNHRSLFGLHGIPSVP